MKIFLLPVLLALLAAGCTSKPTDPLAFPGAEGFGKYTTGGRGGKVNAAIASQILIDRFDADDTSEAQLFSFAHLWAKINRHSAISYDGGYETMTRENVNEIVGRYFGLGISPADGTDYSAALGMGNYDWDHCWYEGGVFYYPAADGEAYNHFTVVDSAEALSGSRTRFRFTVYELDLDRYWADGVANEYYRLTPAEAVQHMTAMEIVPVRTGVAVVLPCYLESSGRESYILVSYELDDIAA